MAEAALAATVSAAAIAARYQMSVAVAASLAVLAAAVSLALASAAVLMAEAALAATASAAAIAARYQMSVGERIEVLRFEKAGMREVVTGIGVLHLVGQQVGLGVGGEGVDVLHMVGKQVGGGGVGEAGLPSRLRAFGMLLSGLLWSRLVCWFGRYVKGESALLVSRVVVGEEPRLCP
jgi:hypothetical protein